MNSTPDRPGTVPAAQPRRPITVYDRGRCAARALGEQRRTDCATLIRRGRGPLPVLRRTSPRHRRAREQVTAGT